MTLGSGVLFFIIIIFLIHTQGYVLLILEREDERERDWKRRRERERKRETLIGCLPYVPQLGIKPTT